MALIPLTKNFVTIVDDEDFERLSKFRWSASKSALSDDLVYAIGPKGLMHRVIIGARPGEIVDHINRNALDNRKANLRLCSHAENMRNSRIHKNNKVGHKNIHLEPIWKNKYQKTYWSYRAEIKSEHKRYRKRFKSLDEAIKWLAQKRLELHGDFARHV